jgi:polyphosphate kinase 2 (PPK2 family)
VVFARVDGAGKSRWSTGCTRGWGEYELAFSDLVERTSTRQAPLTLVAANDKRYARIEVLRTLCERLETVLADVPKS